MGKIMILGLAIVLLGSLPAAAKDLPLAENDCRKCHAQQIESLREDGGGHRTLNGCIACHPGHPPRDLEVVRPCSHCHQGSAHVDWKGPCLACHRDPHRPLQLTLAREAVAACLTCHPTVGEELTAAPSAHSIYACTGCHPRHPQVFPCLECHLPHTAGDSGESCRNCHPPHRPLAIAFDTAMESGVCAGCHADVSAALAEGGGKHLEVGCAGCHAGEHGHIPECGDCHEQPHPAAILDKFPACSQCHKEAHRPIR